MKKTGMTALLLGLLILTLIPSAFASGTSDDKPQTEKCEGTLYKIDNSGVPAYKMKSLARSLSKVLDPRYETVLRAVKNVANFSRTAKWQACE